ncbi:unnamed protein product [Urochloa humidicola]
MAFLAPAAGAASLSLRAPTYVVASSSSSVRRSVKAAASSGSGSPHPILSSLRLAASAAVLLAATSPALASTPSAPPPPPTPLTTSADPDGGEDASSQFQKLIVETAALARAGGAEAARARLSAAEAGCDESFARLLAAQALFVDGKAEEAIAALEELAREDPSDYRPLFCQSVVYLALGKVAESESVLERCRAVSGDAGCCAPALMVSAVGEEAVDGAEEKAEPEPAAEV